ncbi:MAG: hypothetical protein ABI212_00415 [Burkholderiaceae bacterium]
MPPSWPRCNAGAGLLHTALDQSQRFWGGLVTDDTIADYVRGLRYADDFAPSLRHGDALLGVAHGVRY